METSFRSVILLEGGKVMYYSEPIDDNYSVDWPGNFFFPYFPWFCKCMKGTSEALLTNIGPTISCTNTFCPLLVALSVAFT